MQQTEKYQLNLIETSDPFLPAALNDNTRKIEAALDAHETAVDSRVDDLDARVTVTECHNFACGTVKHSSRTCQDIMVGFTPKLVWLRSISKDRIFNFMVISDNDPLTDGTFHIIEGGFHLESTNYVITDDYYFLAFA